MGDSPGQIWVVQQINDQEKKGMEGEAGNENRPKLLQNVKVIKDKERPRNCHRLEKTKEPQ